MRLWSRLIIGPGIALAMPALAPAQMSPVGVPKGVLRIEVDGMFDAFDRRFREGAREPWSADLSSPALGSDRLPGLGALDTRLQRITNTTDVNLSLGRLSTDAVADISTAVLGASYGFSDRLTVFGRIPLTSTRTQFVMRLDPIDANAGFVPEVDAQATFFTQFETALGTLNTKLTGGDYNGNPTTRALAEATLTDGQALYDDLFALLGSPDPRVPFAPTAASMAGARVITRIETLQNTLSSDLAVDGFLVAPRLPVSPIAAADFIEYLNATDGTGLSFRPGQTQLRFRGDAELGAAYTLTDTWDSARVAGGVRTAVSALLRLPTAVQDRPERLIDLGSGDGQADIELSVVSDIANRRWGTRVSATYVRQLPGDFIRRVSAPGQPFVGNDRLAVVRWNPGDVIALNARPFYRMTSTLGIQGSADHWRRGGDTYRYSDGAIDGVGANVLAEGSKASATILGLGMTYANVGRLAPRGSGLPVEASWMWERVVGSGEGRVPAMQRVRAMLRLYVQLLK